MLYRDVTPLEEHQVEERTVLVKRDDLYGIPPAPPLGKLRGLRRILRRAYDGGGRLVGCWDTQVSTLGLGVAAECRNYDGLRCVVAFSAKRDERLPPQFAAAHALGAELLRLTPNHVDICFAQTRKQVTGRNGIMLPFGLECQDSVDAVADEARRIPVHCSDGGTIVVCCGSGVTVSGLIRGLRGRPRRIIGVSSGRSIQRIARCVKRYVEDIPSSLELVPASMPYASAPETTCPFPAHPNYDLKAWQHLKERIATFSSGPILFWNIGA
jgi:1-aminocyclopropane-1-carboxylate deaminase/D-cysteine desulfhydrase-like pyridoxal-dependent ACC family enzyme